MLLAVDGGGTKTQVLLADNSGSILSKNQSGPLNFTVAGPTQALHNLEKALQIVDKDQLKTEKISKVLIGLAGVDTEKEIAKASSLFTKALESKFHCPVEVVNDTVIALASGTMSSNAMVIIAGTGSNCYGRNYLNQTAKAGGLDYLLSDEGSGYWLGREVLRAAVKSADGRGEKTMLEELVKQHFGIPEISQLKEHVYKSTFTKADVARLSLLTIEAKKAHDQITLQLFVQAAEELSRLVIAVGEKLNFKNTYFDLVMVGSMFSAGVIPVGDFKRYVLSVFSKVNPILPKEPPVYGALKLLLAASQ